jgi:hypothetical protein
MIKDEIRQVRNDLRFWALTKPNEIRFLVTIIVENLYRLEHWPNDRPMLFEALRNIAALEQALLREGYLRGGYIADQPHQIDTRRRPEHGPGPRCRGRHQGSHRAIRDQEPPTSTTAGGASDRPMNLNSGKPWSQMALYDLRYWLKHGDSVEQVAELLCRDVNAVREKMVELGIRERPQP